MDLLTLLYLYFGLIIFVIFVLLFGQSPALSNTPLPWLYWLLTAAWIDALQWLTGRVAGDRGLRALDALVAATCEQRNPILQLVYLTILGSGYYAYWEYLFKLLPNPGAGEHHMFYGTGVTCLCLSLFTIVSSSSPGAITPESAAAYAAAYPPDGTLFPLDAPCPPCGGAPRPARSKHCRLCGACVPRFDHHCGWVNTCIGLHNARLFLAFLAAHMGMCAYAVLLAVRILGGELQRRGLLDLYVYDAAARRQVPVRSSNALLFRVAVAYFPMQLAVAGFMGLTGLLMAVFLGHQALLISTGCTTYEAARWRRLAAERRARAMAAAPAAPAAAVAAAAGQQLEPAGGSGWLHYRWLRRLKAGLGWSGGGVRGHDPSHEVVADVPVNMYDRGLWSNWSEVLFPERFLQQQAAAAQACTQQGQGAEVAGAGDACSRVKQA